MRAPRVWPFTTQFYFPNEPDNLRDDYFRRDLVMDVKQAGEGLIAQFDLVLETFRNPAEHDPEKWGPVFGKDHAPTNSQSGMTIRRIVIPLPEAGRTFRFHRN